MTSQSTDDLVKQVCPYLRGAPDECLGCPATEESSYGPGKRGCRSLAESVITIVSASQADTIERLQRELSGTHKTIGEFVDVIAGLQSELADRDKTIEALRRYERRFKDLLPLFEEARDALPAITETSRRLRGISPTLADRMDEVGEPERWKKLDAARSEGAEHE